MCVLNTKSAFCLATLKWIVNFLAPGINVMPGEKHFLLKSVLFANVFRSASTLGEFVCMGVCAFLFVCILMYNGCLHNGNRAVCYCLIALICRAFTLNISGSLDSILNTMSLIWSDLKAKCEKFFSPILLWECGWCDVVCVRACLCYYVFKCETSINSTSNLLKKFHYDCGQISLSNEMNEVLKKKKTTTNNLLLQT